MSVTSIFRSMQPNSLDFPLIETIVKDKNKTCPRCKSHLRTVLRDVAGPTGGTVECYGCRVAFDWVKTKT